MIETTKPEFNKINLIAIVVIAIILVFVILSSVGYARAKARDVKRVRDVQYIQEALKLYYNDNLDYPSAVGNPASAKPDQSACTDLKTQFKCYMPEYPDYPKPADGSVCENYKSYAYSKIPLSEGGYRITFCLGDEAEGISSGVHKATAKGIN